jgi:hypothetical protein
MDPNTPQVASEANRWRSKVIIACIACFALFTGLVALDEHEFNSMTPAQHLRAARGEAQDTSRLLS